MRASPPVPGSRAHRWLVRGLVLLGLSRGLIWLGGGHIVQMGLVQFLVSPLPMVFDRPGFFSDMAVEVQTAEGTWRRPIDAEAVARLRGPLDRRSTLSQTLTQGTAFPPELRDPIAQFLLCDPGLLVRELDGPGPAIHAAFYTRAPMTGESFALRVDCP